MSHPQHFLLIRLAASYLHLHYVVCVYKSLQEQAVQNYLDHIIQYLFSTYINVLILNKMEQKHQQKNIMIKVLMRSGWRLCKHF